MASIFDKISDKAGDTRKSSTWYRNAVSSLGCLLYTSDAADE